jgi:hypothetical protein
MAAVLEVEHREEDDVEQHGGRRVEAERKRTGGRREWRRRGRSRARVGDSLGVAYKGEGRRMGAVPSCDRRRGVRRCVAVRGRKRHEGMERYLGQAGLPRERKEARTWLTRFGWLYCRGFFSLSLLLNSSNQNLGQEEDDRMGSRKEL